jgi:hypothetical protein
MDFNLPQPQHWHITWRTMPQMVYNSQLSVIDGYIYLFGGQNSDIIWRAPTNNPADWVDTGARLPSILGGSQYADPNDGYIYLIGGENVEAVDTIFRAPKSNPLAWTNLGSKLPEPLHKSSLIIADGYMYLLGGQGLNHAISKIFRATVTAPTVWTDTGSVIPQQMYGSVPAIIGGKMYLFGGLLLEDSPTNRVFSASLSAPLTWNLDGYLPYAASYGQFVTVGTHGYLFTSASITDQNYFTRILRMDLTAPGQWVDVLAVLPGELSQSQLAVIYDRVFLFGGNGNSIVLACDQKLKYLPAHPQVLAYAATTRTAFDAVVNPLDKFKILGYPAWKTDY